MKKIKRILNKTEIWIVTIISFFVLAFGNGFALQGEYDEIKSQIKYYEMNSNLYSDVNRSITELEKKIDNMFRFNALSAFVVATSIFNFLNTNRKRNNNNEKEDNSVEKEYECIHCGYTQNDNFDFCPKCKKNDDGLTA